MIGMFHGEARRGTGVTPLTLQDSIRSDEIATTEFTAVRNVLISGTPASGMSVVWELGGTAAEYRLALMMSGTRSDGASLPIIGAFSPPGWRRDQVVSAIFPNALRMFVVSAGSIATDAHGQFVTSSMSPLSGHVSATATFSGQDSVVIEGDVSVLLRGDPPGCTGL